MILMNVLHLRCPKNLLTNNILSNLLRLAGTSSTDKELQHGERSINSVQLLGRVGRDPQWNATDEHSGVVFFLATDIVSRDEFGHFLQQTEWHQVICFKPGLQETVMNYLRKGNRVHVSGRITYGGDDANSKATTSVVAEDIVFSQRKSKLAA